MRHLHEEPTHESFLDVHPVGAFVGGGYELDFETFHGAEELGTDIVGLSESAAGDVVVPGPVFVVDVCEEENR